MQASTKHGSLGALTLGALGVVFGDIGTSPIYALRESLHTAGTELYDPKSLTLSPKVSGKSITVSWKSTI